MKIELITCESGDWEVLLVDGKFYEEGRSISKWAWLELLKDLGHEVIDKEITDEEMENGDY